MKTILKLNLAVKEKDISLINSLMLNLKNEKYIELERAFNLAVEIGDMEIIKALHWPLERIRDAKSMYYSNEGEYSHLEYYTNCPVIDDIYIEIMNMYFQVFK